MSLITRSQERLDLETQVHIYSFKIHYKLQLAKSKRIFKNIWKENGYSDTPYRYTLSSFQLSLHWIDNKFMHKRFRSRVSQNDRLVCACNIF